MASVTVTEDGSSEQSNDRINDAEHWYPDDHVYALFTTARRLRKTNSTRGIARRRRKRNATRGIVEEAPTSSSSSSSVVQPPPLAFMRVPVATAAASVVGASPPPLLFQAGQVSTLSVNGKSTNEDGLLKSVKANQAGTSDSVNDEASCGDEESGDAGISSTEKSSAMATEAGFEQAIMEPVKKKMKMADTFNSDLKTPRTENDINSEKPGVNGFTTTTLVERVAELEKAIEEKVRRYEARIVKLELTVSRLVTRVNAADDINGH